MVVTVVMATTILKTIGERDDRKFDTVIDECDFIFFSTSEGTEERVPRSL